MSNTPNDLYSFEVNGAARDLTGYGMSKPHPKWPNGAKVAVSFVLNFEEGAENCVLNGPAPDGCQYDHQSEHLLNDNPGAPPTVGDRNINIESLYEFGSRAGFHRILSIFQKAGMKSDGENEYKNKNFRPIPLTVYSNACAIKQNPEIGHAMVNASWELATHGYRWIDYHKVSYDVEVDHVQKCVDEQEDIIGYPPIGFYVGRPSKSSRTIAMRTLSSQVNDVDNNDENKQKKDGLFKGFLYDNDAYNDDLPYWFRADQLVLKEQGGDDENNNNNNKTLPAWARPMLILPYTLELNDRKFVSGGAGYSSCEDFFESVKGAILQLLHEVNEDETEYGIGVPKMISIGLHCRLSGRPSRAYAIKKILDWILEYNSQHSTRPDNIPADRINHYTPIWITRRIEIARHWYNNFYPVDTTVPNPINDIDVLPQDFDKYADEHKAAMMAAASSAAAVKK